MPTGHGLLHPVQLHQPRLALDLAVPPPGLGSHIMIMIICMPGTSRWAYISAGAADFAKSQFKLPRAVDKQIKQHHEDAQEGDPL